MTTFFAYTPGAFCTIQHLTGTLAFSDHWPHDLHDLAEMPLIFITVIIFRRGGESNPGHGHL